MKKKMIIVGVAIVSLGCLGTYNAINSFDKKPVEKKDITTEGYVTDLTATKIKHQIGITVSTTYRMKYAFEADDGKYYHGEEIIEKRELGELAEGRPVTIQYHSNNPAYNAAPAYGAFTSVSELPQTTSQSRLNFSLGTIAVGIAFILCTVYVVKWDAPDSEEEGQPFEPFATQTIAPDQHSTLEEDADDYSNLATARLLINRPTE